jgi:predicted nucleotidyltransferase
VPPDLEDQNRRIVAEVMSALGDRVIAIYRFGSTAHGTATVDSDIDVALLAHTPLAADVRFGLQERLAGALRTDVDLVDLASASPVMAVQVTGHGELVYEADSVARGEFEDRVLGAYARLNEERRGILERVAREGTVYGR